jgi:hypothetical protein
MSGSFGNFQSLLARASAMQDDRLKPTDEEVQRRETAAQKAREETLVIAKAWAAFAATEGGRSALDQLTGRTLLRATHVYQPDFTAEQIALSGCYREGQNDVVWQILMLIAAANGEAQPARVF